jgi:hypothetical protein
MFIVSEMKLQAVRECFTHTKLTKTLPVYHGLIILLICVTRQSILFYTKYSFKW